jgi:hypothetical protein
MKRILSSITFLLLITFSVQAQQRSGIGINLFPNYSHRRLVAFDLMAQSEADSLEANETAVPAYAAGLFLSYRSEKAGVQVGINYAQTGYTSKRIPIPFNDPAAANFSEQRYSFRAHQIEVPFAVYFYQGLSDKDDFFFSMGSGLSYNLNNQDVITRFAGESNSKEVTEAAGDFRRMSYNFQTSMGWEHRLGENIVFSLAPSFRIWLAGIYREAPLNRNLYQFGVRATVRFDREIVYID